MQTQRLEKRRRGQILVLFAVGLVTIILAVGLVVDVGFAFAQQRSIQNGADAAARAGAILLAQRAAEGPSSSVTATDVWDAVVASADANDVAIEEALYTDWQGNILPGSPSVSSVASPIPTNAAGVWAVSRRTPDTFLVRVVGINSWTIDQQATAVSGPTTGCVDTLEGCVLLPVTFPVTVFQCTNNGKTLPITPPQTWVTGQLITLPICGGNPGSVGWIDWTPTEGGTDELEEVILDPPTVNVPLPSWQYITSTGDISAKKIEDAINTYAGQVVSLPMFDSTCNETPFNNQVSGCPAGAEGGAGQNQWYHITGFLYFELDEPKGAYVNGNNEAICAVANAKECIKGAFVTFLGEGPVGAPCPVTGCPAGTKFSVQLIK